MQFLFRYQKLASIQNYTVTINITKTSVEKGSKKRVRNTSTWFFNKHKASYFAGKEYISKKGKTVSDRFMKTPCSWRMKCSDKLCENDILDILGCKQTA